VKNYLDMLLVAIAVNIATPIAIHNKKS